MATQSQEGDVGEQAMERGVEQVERGVEGGEGGRWRS